MASGVGEMLRGWREHRHLSQSDLSARSDVSSRHLSYIETGRSRPSREMVLYLAEHLGVPLRERNALLLAAGYAPVFSQRALGEQGSDMTYIRQAVERLLASHEPYPAVVIDRGWEVVARNAGTEALLGGVALELLVPPVNALRLALHPAGLAPRIANLAEWSDYLLRRLEQQILVTGDRGLTALADEVRAYPGVGEVARRAQSAADRVFVPLRLMVGAEELSFLNMVATFGTAVDVTASELVIEAFYPADQATARALARPAANAAVARQANVTDFGY